MGEPGTRARPRRYRRIVREVPDLWALLIALAFGLAVFVGVLFVLAVAAF